MIWTLLVLFICTFVVLKKTHNIFITAAAFTVGNTVFKLFGGNPITELLIYAAIIFVYGVVLFALLKKFYEDDNTVAFTLVLCFGPMLMYFFGIY